MARNKKKTTKIGRVAPTRASPTTRKRKEQQKIIENKKFNEIYPSKSEAKSPWQLEDPTRGPSGKYVNLLELEDVLGKAAKDKRSALNDEYEDNTITETDVEKIRREDVMVTELPNAEVVYML